MTRLPLTGALALAAALLALGLGGCAAPRTPAPVPAPHTASPGAVATAAGARYRCDQAIAFTVHFADDSAVLDAGPRGSEVLLRDAGGATPQQTVYSNGRMRAEFGLGVGGREAMLSYASPPLKAHCVQE